MEEATSLFKNNTRYKEVCMNGCPLPWRFRGVTPLQPKAMKS